MAKDEAKLTFSADDREVARAWQKQFEQLDRLERKLDQAGKAGSDAAVKSMKSFATWALGIASVKMAIDTLIGAYRRAEEANQRFRQSSAETTQQTGDLLFRLGNQGNLSALPPAQQAAALENMRLRLSRIDEREGMPAGVSLRHATEAASQGVQGDLGDAAEFFAQLSAAMNRGGEDPEGLVQAVVAMTKSAGLDATPENLRRVGIAMQRSFKAEPMQLADFEKLASRGAGITGMTGASPELMIALGSVLREVMPGEKGATAAEAIATRLATAGGNKTRVDALAMLGLKPEDVDMVGEDFVEALERINERMQQVDQATGNIALNKLVGEGAQSGMLTLLASTAEIRRRAGAYDDPEGFRTDVEFMRRNPAAAVRAAEERRLRAQFDPGSVIDQQILAEMETAGRELRYDPYEVEAWQKFYTRHRNRGRTPSQAVHDALSGSLDIQDFIGAGEGPFDNFVEAISAGVIGGGRDELASRILDPNAETLRTEFEARAKREIEAALFERQKALARSGGRDSALGMSDADRELMRTLQSLNAEMAELNRRLGDEQKVTLEINGVQLPGKKVQP